MSFSGQLPLFSPSPLPHPAAHPRLRLGTASWAYPGWNGLVYAGHDSAATLSRDGLQAYAAHPLLRAVALDRVFYAPLKAADYAAHARQVPDDFRFLVKAPQLLTRPDSAHYLSPEAARRWLDEPAREGLGEKLGALHFFLPPGPPHPDLPRRLGRLLAALQAPCSVEVRHPELLGDDYRRALEDAGASHAWNVVPGMPREQPLVGPLRLVRWTLRPAPVQPWNLREAALRYLPFSQLRDPDPDTREWLACRVTDWLDQGEQVMIVANNKAEGCAPLSLLELARRLEHLSKTRRRQGG